MRSTVAMGIETAIATPMPIDAMPDRTIANRLLAMPRRQSVGRSSGSSATSRPVRADGRALLDHDHGQLAAGLGGQLLQADGGGKTGGASTNDDDVELHRLPGRQFGCGLGHFLLHLVSWRASFKLF